MKLPSRNFKKMLLSVSQDGYKDGLQKMMLPTTSKLCMLLLISKTLSKLSTILPVLMLPKFSEIELLLIEPMVKSFPALKKIPSQPLPSLPVNSMLELFKNPTMLSTPQLSHQLKKLKKRVKVKKKRVTNRKNQKQPVEIEPSIDQCQG